MGIAEKDIRGGVRAYLEEYDESAFEDPHPLLRDFTYENLVEAEEGEFRAELEKIVEVREDKPEQPIYKPGPPPPMIVEGALSEDFAERYIQREGVEPEQLEELAKKAIIERAASVVGLAKDAPIEEMWDRVGELVQSFPPEITEKHMEALIVFSNLAKATTPTKSAIKAFKKKFDAPADWDLEPGKTEDFLRGLAENWEIDFDALVEAEDAHLNEALEELITFLLKGAKKVAKDVAPDEEEPEEAPGRDLSEIEPRDLGSQSITDPAAKTGRTLLVMGCCKSKRRASHTDSALRRGVWVMPALERYTGVMFQTLKKHGIANHVDVVILSAKHGLIHKDTKIENYDTTMTAQTRRGLEADSTQYVRIRNTLDGYAEVFVAAGGEYRKMISSVTGQEFPGTKGAIGIQRQQLGEWARDQNEKEAEPAAEPKADPERTVTIWSRFPGKEWVVERSFPLRYLIDARGYPAVEGKTRPGPRARVEYPNQPPGEWSVPEDQQGREYAWFEKGVNPNDIDQAKDAKKKPATAESGRITKKPAFTPTSVDSWQEPDFHAFWMHLAEDDELGEAHLAIFRDQKIEISGLAYSTSQTKAGYHFKQIINNLICKADWFS